LAVLALGADKLPAARQVVERWAAQNPIRSPSFARPTARLAFPRAIVGERKGALALMASADQQLIELGERIAMMNESMLGRVRWLGDLLIQDALGTTDVSRLLEGSTQRMLASSTQLIDRERERAFAQVADERAAIFAEVDRLRATVLDDVARERTQIFAQVASERATILTEARQLLDRANVSAGALAKRVVLGMGLVGAALVLLAALAVWLVRLASRRPPTARPHRPRRPTDGVDERGLQLQPGR
jgi:hypothetical protein